GDAQQHAKDQEREPVHWIFPVGRIAVMLSAHSTAVTADTRRLSAAAQSHTPLGCVGSILIESWISACPAELTLLGASSSPRGMATWSPPRTRAHSSNSTAWSISTNIAMAWP